MARPRKKAPAPVPPNEMHPWAHLAPWRDHAGLTQEQVANILEVSSVTIHRWETGKVPLTVPNLIKLAEIYGAPSFTHLTYGPTHKELVGQAIAGMRLLDRMTPKQRDAWIKIGAELVGEEE